MTNLVIIFGIQTPKIFGAAPEKIVVLLDFNDSAREAEYDSPLPRLDRILIPSSVLLAYAHFRNKGSHGLQYNYESSMFSV